jgi:hypothetical protein
VVEPVQLPLQVRREPPTRAVVGAVVAIQEVVKMVVMAVQVS